MSAEFHRCPLCATVLEIHTGIWKRLWPFGVRETTCRSCRHTVAIRDARVMGQSFAYWAAELRQHLLNAVKKLPNLPREEALNAMSRGLTNEQTRNIATSESLAHFVVQMCRPIIADQAHGRTAHVEVMILEERGKPVAVGVLGKTSAESGDKDTELLLARIGTDQYLVHLPLKLLGRVQEAQRAQRGEKALRG